MDSSKQFIWERANGEPPGLGPGDSDFEYHLLDQFNGPWVCLVKTPACHVGDEGIVTPRGRQFKSFGNGSANFHAKSYMDVLADKNVPVQFRKHSANTTFVVL